MNDIFRTTNEEVNLAEALDFIHKHQSTVLPRLNYLKNYYDGKHDILNRTFSDTTKPNNKIVNNFPSFIVDTTAGYFMGTPVSYSHEDAKALDAIAPILNYNDEADMNAQHAENMGIYGSSYELLYIDKEAPINIRFAAISPKEMFIVYDYSISFSPVYAIRYYQDTTITGICNKFYVEIYTKNRISNYNLIGSEWELTSEVEHFFNDVPVIEFFNNTDRFGDYEKVLTLIDQYNQLESDSANDFEYFSDAYLFIKGANIDEDTAVNMKQDKIINITDANAAAEFLTKDIQDAALENLKNRIVNDIHKFSFVPNLTDESFSGNLSGVAIKYKLIGLENIAAKKERRFKKALQRRLELIFQMLYVKGISNNINYYDVTINFKRTIPANELEQAEKVRDLVGTVSTQTLLGQLDFIEDVNKEMELLAAEQAKDNSFDKAFEVNDNGAIES